MPEPCLSRSKKSIYNEHRISRSLGLENRKAYELTLERDLIETSRAD